MVLTVPAKQNSSRSNSALVGDSHDGLGSEQRATSAAQWAVSGDVDAGLVAEIDNLLLGEQGVVLDLVGSGDNSGLGQEFLEELDAVVGHTDGLDLAGANELLHTLPCSNVGVAVDNVPRSIGELREEVVVACVGSGQHLESAYLKKPNSPLGFIAKGQCIRYRST
jgi:hypothetical protein